MAEQRWLVPLDDGRAVRQCPPPREEPWYLLGVSADGRAWWARNVDSHDFVDWDLTSADGGE